MSAAGASMRWPETRLVLLLVAALSSLACGGAPVGEFPLPFVVPTPDTAPDAAIAAFVSMDKGGLPALMVGVIDGGATVYTNVTGVRKRGDPTRVTVDDAFHIGSNTKAMTALVAGMVVDAGQLTWDSTVGDVLASTIEVGEPYRTVTLAQLLDHSSGLPNDQDFAPADLASFQESTAPVASERRRMAELALALPPTAAPGMYFRYSNLGYVVAGLMLEVVTGESWEALLEERLFTPLGMAHAGFGTPATPGLVDAPWGHDPLPQDAGTRPVPEAFGPSGTVHANLADLIAYVHLYLDDGSGPQGRVISEVALAEIETPRLHHYGFGWFLDDDENGQLVMWHNGSIGTFYSTLVLFPERRGAIIMVTNAGDDAAWTRIGELDGYLSAHFGLPLQRP